MVGYHRETHHFREEKSTKELTVPQHTRFILPLTSPDKIHRCAAWAVFFFYGHLSGRRPLHLANARPFGRSKAPLGLLLLRKRGILLSEETKNPNPSPIEKRFGFSLFGAMEGTRTPGLLIRSQSLYPAELPTHTFRSEQDVFYHAGRGLSTVFRRFFDFIFVFYFSAQKSTSFRFCNISRADLRLPLPDARRCGHRSSLRQGRPGRSPADRGRADCPRGPWHR